jgi:hypothetical protein
VEDKWDGYISGKLKYESGNPLEGQVTRVYFVSRSKGKNRKRKRLKEVELIGVGRGRFHTIKDKPTHRLDSLAEELIPQGMVPPELTPFQFFLNWFYKLPANGKGRKKIRG